MLLKLVIPSKYTYMSFFIYIVKKHVYRFLILELLCTHLNIIPLDQSTFLNHCYLWG